MNKFYRENSHKFLTAITSLFILPLVLTPTAKAADVTPPELTVVTPTSGDVFSGSMYVEVQTKGDESGILAVNARVVNEKNASYNKTNDLKKQGSTDTYSGSVNIKSLPDGKYYLLVRSWNAWEGTNAKTSAYVYGLVIDNSIPTVSITQPQDDYKTLEAFEATGTASDGYGLDYVELYTGDAGTDTWTLLTTLDNVTNSTNFNWAYSWTPAAEGMFDLKAVSYDIANTPSLPAVRTGLIYDVTAPVVVSITPMPTTVDATLDVSVEVTDNLAGIRYVVARFENLDNTNDATSQTLVYNNGTNRYEGTLVTSGLPNGTNYRLQITPYDLAEPWGNHEHYDYTFYTVAH